MEIDGDMQVDAIDILKKSKSYASYLHGMSDMEETAERGFYDGAMWMRHIYESTSPKPPNWMIEFYKLGKPGRVIRQINNLTGTLADAMEIGKSFCAEGEGFTIEPC